ncbi:rhomboid family intramembrane serine protease [Kitasatospora sp. MMS16-BH015]|uniref:rhomboid family intramembrane serine protease n=1 Tax=Kitasatospora sp. MMS16-BH015 TaxID=2018025 RepID=UPI000CA3936D|nr:rhomboid family intramembrane serine protease [Kitasatospora sp. MMS16-BH015]AUG76799.1 rhomboid family intramembrane serine protease [Kitasatospora sp. MMS16-BH015]
MALPLLDRLGLRGAGRAAPVVTLGLIAVCLLVLVVSPSSGLNPLYGTGQARVCAEERYEQRWGAVPAELTTGHPLTAEQLGTLAAALPGCELPATPAKVPALSVLTSLFVHAGWLHLLGNVLFLLVFGPAVEERLGRARFLLLYLTVGYLAAYGYAIAQAHSPDGLRAVVGASGAIAGVLGGYLRLFPRARVTALVPVLLFLPLRLPAWLVLGLWFVLQWWSVRTGGPGVAYLVHVIGFATGYLTARVATARRIPWRRPPGLGEPE